MNRVNSSASFLRRYFLILIFISHIINMSESNQSYLQEFYSKSTLSGGVHELTLFLHGIRAKETIVGPKEGSPRGIVVRQLSNGRQLLNIIYNGMPRYIREEEGGRDLSDEDEQSLLGNDGEGLKIRECLVEKSPEQVRIFVENFDLSAEKLRNMSTTLGLDSSLLNTNYITLKDRLSDEIPQHLRAITQFKELKHKCFKLNRKVRKIAKAQKAERLRNEKQQNETSLTQRSRRGLKELLILPGTKWCGNGRLAKSYNDLDGYMVADHCCRDHDLCPSSIPRLSRKFGLYNYGLTTISHCSCDKRFKTCLKQTGTGAANVVGNVFFSLVKSSCFDFKQKKVCKKRGFWNCLKWGYEKQAVIRNPISWNM